MCVMLESSKHGSLIGYSLFTSHYWEVETNPRNFLGHGSFGPKKVYLHKIHNLYVVEILIMRFRRKERKNPQNI